ncbi:MAG TPA: hypothetical protein VNK41_03450 [Vicinamibacterales bacterium]|nr:hypothetical protein [Vicinamibacterales bacterium]
MLKKYLIGAIAAAMLSTGAAAAQYGDDQQSQPDPADTQQTPTTQDDPATSSPPDSTSESASAASTTLTGCVYREEDVPGRTPNVAEQAGVLEDYILAVSETPGAGTAGTSGTAAAAGRMFKLEHVADEELSRMVGKRVEVTGKIEAEAGDTGATGATGTTGDASVGPDRIELPEFEVTSIREVGGDCPATPGAGR